VTGGETEAAARDRGSVARPWRRREAMAGGGREWLWPEKVALVAAMQSQIRERRDAGHVGEGNDLRGGGLEGRGPLLQ
jgi:hypothetical protein